MLPRIFVERAMAKVTGIGGVFFKTSSNDKALSSWYQKHLGIELRDFGGAILSWDQDRGEDSGLTVWHIANKDSDWFQPSASNFMINYRVDDMNAMISQLEDGGVEILAGPEYHENGIFLWILDPDGNKIELWEPKTWNEKNKR